METKICTKCGKELPATNKYFCKRNNTRLKLIAECKMCTSERNKKAYQKDITKYKEKSKLQHKSTKEKNINYSYIYEQGLEKTCTMCNKTFPATPDYFYKMSTGKYGLKAECKCCTSTKKKNYYNIEQNKIKIKEQANKWIINNKDRKQETDKLWHKKHRLENKEYYKIRNKKYVNTLTPHYVAKVCRVSVKDLTPELLEQKRLTILIKRELLWQKEI